MIRFTVSAPQEVTTRSSEGDNRIETALVFAFDTDDRCVARQWSYISGSNFNQEQSYQFVKEVMSLPDRPTALFCANNVMVEGALTALGELGLRIYDDVSVVGLGNILCNRYIHPRITTLFQDSRQMGREAGIAIGNRINDKESVPYMKLLQTPFEVNESVRAI